MNVYYRSETARLLLKSVHVGYEMIKSLWPQEEMRTRIERKKFIMLTDPREEGTHHAVGGAHREGPGLVRRQRKQGENLAII